MHNQLLLFSNFIKHPKEVGALTPSSKFLTKEIVKNIKFKNSKCIVELGPGLGTFTKVILKKLGHDSKLLCFEVNAEFCSYIKENIIDKRLVIINSGAENMCHNLRKFNVKKADFIVSGLPFLNFSDAQKKKILREIKNSINNDGKFILFQYTNGLSSLLEYYFSKVKRKFVPLNVPPSFVYVCEK